MIDAPEAADFRAVPDPMRVALEVEIPSDVRYIERIVSMVVRQCAELSFPRRAIQLNVPVALSEALSNAILRGNNEDPELAVRVRACLDAEQLVLEVEDEGQGFELDVCFSDPTLPDNLEREDGRGLFLMQRLMDRVEQVRESEGNVVRMVLQRDGVLA
jgi:serine/threonine-protein kinase RsbW